MVQQSRIREWPLLYTYLVYLTVFVWSYLYLVSLLFGVPLSLHLATFLMFFLVNVLPFFIVLVVI